MTLKELLNFGRYQETQATPPLDQYYNEFNSHDRGWHGSKSKGHSGGSGAAISALTLLAFLFLLNVMQQSLQDNNNTTVTTTATTIFLRNIEPPISLASRVEENKNIEEDVTENPNRNKPEEKISYIKIKNP